MNCAHVGGACGHGCSTKYGGVAYYGAVQYVWALLLSYSTRYMSQLYIFKIPRSGFLAPRAARVNPICNVTLTLPLTRFCTACACWVGGVNCDG